MKYFVEINGRRFEVELPDSSRDGGLKLNGKIVRLEHRRVSPGGEVELIRDGKPRIAEVDGSGGSCRVQIGGFDFDATILDEREELLRRYAPEKQARTGVAGEIKAPMPGLVVKVEVAPGDRVRRGQGVMVIEAMKMENEIAAPMDGTVELIKVKPGQPVEKGEALMTIKGDN